MPAGVRTYLHRKSQRWPPTAQDPRELVHRPCRFNPDIFTSTYPAEVKVAKMSCTGCPERSPCLQHGLELDETVDCVGGNRNALHGVDGIYGGLTRAERVKIRRTRATTERRAS